VDSVTLILAVAIAFVAGIVRGITGFGGAMVMSPPFALLLGAKLAVPVILLLEGLVAAPMLARTRRLVRWNVMLPMSIAALVAAPLGTYLLLATEPDKLRQAIAITVLVFAALLLVGWRYSGPQRAVTGASLGALSGAMASATSISGPPVILYLLAGPDPIETTRANLMFFICAVSVAGLAMLALAGAFDPRALWLTLAMAPGYYAGILAGARLFARFDEARFRKFTLLLMMTVAAAILVA
jgi:uncharacterized membrane protein YfcA